VSSNAYKPQQGSPCSAYVAAECTYDDVLRPYTTDGASVGAVTVAVCRNQNYVIQRDVLPGEHPSHVHLIEPPGLSKGQRHALQKEMARQTRWVAGRVSWASG
jgi:hypothetical protein